MARHGSAVGGFRRVRPRVPPVIVIARSWSLVVTLLLVWFVSGVGHASDKSIPTPQGVLDATKALLMGGILQHALVASWSTVLVGFGIGTAVGMPLGMLMGFSQWIRRWLEPLVGLMRPIAPFAWIPMAILWFGASSRAGIVITAYAAFFPIITNSLAGVSRVQRSFILAARTLGAGNARIFLNIVFWGSLPLVMVGLRLGMGLAWASVIAAEIATGQSTTSAAGLGYLMYLNFSTSFNSNIIVSMMVMVGISSFLADSVLRYLAGRLIVWPAEG